MISEQIRIGTKTEDKGKTKGRQREDKGKTKGRFCCLDKKTKEDKVTKV